MSLRSIKTSESEGFGASAEQLDQFREVLDVLVRQVKGLEDRFGEMPKRAEFESMAGRSTDHAVDRLLLGLNQSVKPMLMANSQQSQPSTARRSSTSVPAGRRMSGTNTEMQGVDLERLGPSWLQYAAEEAANEATAQAALVAAARHAGGRRGSRCIRVAAVALKLPPKMKKSAYSRGSKGDTANSSGESRVPRRGSISAGWRRVTDKVGPNATDAEGFPSPAGRLSVSPTEPAASAPARAEEGGTAADVKTEASSPPEEATRSTRGARFNEANSGDTMHASKLEVGSASTATEASKLGSELKACRAVEPSPGQEGGNGDFHQRVGTTDDQKDQPAASSSSLQAYPRDSDSVVSVLEDSRRRGSTSATFSGAGTRKGPPIRWIVLPTSRGRRTWDLIVLLVALLSALLAPIQLAFWTDVRTSWLRCVLGLCINAVWLLQVAINFRTGFEKEGVIVTTPRAVAMRYLKTAFGFDLLCCWPDELVLLGSGLASPGGHADSADRSEHLRNPAFYMLFLKAFCVLALVRCFQTQETHGGLNPGLLRLTRVMMILILMCHWVGCLWWLIAEIEGPGVVMEESNLWVPFEWRELLLPGPTLHKLSPVPLGSKYVHALFWGVSLVSGITVMEFEPATDLEIAYTTACVLSGLGIYCYVLSSATAAVTRIDSRDSGHREQLEQIDRFLRFKRVSERVRTRIADYLDFIHSTASTDGLDFMRMLPVALQAQLSLALNMNCLTRVPILQRCTAEVDSSVMVALVMKLTTSIHLPQDVVLRQGDMCSSLGFINRGMLEAITNMGAPTETIVQVLHDNDFWGQVMLVVDRPAKCSVRSISYSDVMSLSREDMMEALSVSASLEVLDKIRPDLHTMADLVSGDLADMVRGSMHRQRERFLRGGSGGGATWARLRGCVIKQGATISKSDRGREKNQWASNISSITEETETALSSNGDS